MDSHLEKKIIPISLLLLDVDGVMTAGQVIYADDGQQVQIFNVKDGLGIRLLKAAEIQVGIITGRSSQALLHRCANLGIDLVFDGIKNKLAALGKVMDQTGIGIDQIAFIGDDLPDLPLMGQVGLSVAVADAHPLVRKAADLVTQAPGGYGAVREVCEAILQVQGKLENIVKRLFGKGGAHGLR